MNGPYGIDTSILVRLLTTEPDAAYRYCVESLNHLVNEVGADVFVSNQVIGEAYVAVQHHYRVSEIDARQALINVFNSGLVQPLNGWRALMAIEATSGPGLFDRLIADGYSQAGCETLTLDRKMANLPNAEVL